MTKSDEELRRAAYHVAHDIQRLDRAFDQQANRFAYTSWFIHCRSVMEFFRKKKKHEDDIHASDFLDSWKNVVEGTKKPDGYKDIRKAVNKLAAHLTWARLKYEKGGKYENKGRPSKEVTNYLLDLYAQLLDALPPERRKWFNSSGESGD